MYTSYKHAPLHFVTLPVGIEPTTHGLAYHYGFRHRFYVCGLDYIFTISGATRVVSTESQGVVGFPRCCHLKGFTDIASFILRVWFPRKRSYLKTVALSTELREQVNLII